MGSIERGPHDRAARRFARRPLETHLFVLVWLIALSGWATPSLAARRAQAPSSPPASGEEAFLQRANQMLARGRLDDAEALAVARGVDDPLAGAVRGRVATTRGRYADAEALLVRAARRDPNGEAALELGLLYVRLGRDAEARPILGTIVEAISTSRTASDLARGARAAWGLRRVRDANAYFRAAAASAPRDPVVNTAWGELLLEKYNRQEAVRSFQAALDADNEWAPAHLGLARALVEENPPAALAAARRALAIDPAYPAAHLFVAELALDEGRPDEARTAVERALATNRSSLEARSLLAAIAYVADRTEEFDAQVAQVLAINPTYGEVYRVAADHAARNYRFDESVALVRKALALDAANSRAHADLGMHLLRTGDESGARAALEQAFRMDPFDVITYNLLSLLDTLDSFQSVREGDLVIRLHPDEAAVLKEYVVPLAREALRSVSERYGHTVRGPILVEIFPRHDDFAVRNVGLPGMIGALGACFGRVVTLDSPRARAPGTFSWQAALWHELAHVVTLQLSNQRVPRWLTEGISVYEETRARPAWGRDAEIAFAQALERGEVLKLRDLNAGFMRPETIDLAYYQASLLVEHVVATYGESALAKLLRAYGEGLDTETALRQAVGADLDQLQGSFDEMLGRRFAALRAALRQPKLPAGDATGELASLRSLAEAHPGSFPVQLTLGQALYAAGEFGDAMRALERAAALAPHATGKDSPRALMAEIARKLGQPDRAISELAALLEHDHASVDAARQLAALADEAGDEPRRRLAYERIVELDPFDTSAHSVLGRLASRLGEFGLAIREFRVALATGPVDRVAAHCDLGESYLLAGRPIDAKHEVLAALEIAPTYERAQTLLLKVAEGRP